MEGGARACALLSPSLSPSPCQGASRTGCCPSRHAMSSDGPQAGCRGRRESLQRWQPGPSPHNARTTAAAAEVPPRPWSGCRYTAWRMVVKTLRSPPHPLTGLPPHLQSGTTMGLSSMPRNSPCSFSAASTTFLASNLGRPWAGDRPRHGCA